MHVAATVERLKRRPEFLRVAAARNSAARPGLILQAMRRERSESGDGNGDGGTDTAGDGTIRYGLTVSRKVGNAVTRNRARRRLRAAAEQTLRQCGMAGVDYVLIGRRGTVHQPFATLIKDLCGAMRQTGTLSGERAGAISGERAGASPKDREGGR